MNQRRRLNARLADAKARPWEMWSFHGASYDWGKDDVVKLTPGFSQTNFMGEMVKGGYGGGIPVVAFWTRAGRRSGRARGDDSDFRGHPGKGRSRWTPER